MRPTRAAVALLLLLVACDGKKDDSGGDPLYTGPELSHDVPATVLAGTPVELAVTATDPDGVSGVVCYHRVEGETEWAQVPMAAAGGDTWTTTLGADDVGFPAVEYYFKATDAGEVAASTWLPEEAADGPFTLTTSVAGLPLPFVEDFEDASGADVGTLGWHNAAEGFRGYPWQLSTAEAVSGTTSAWHPLGYPDVTGITDWLISPPLDLSAATGVQVTWREYGNNVGQADHGLWISTGDYTDLGSYVPVAKALPAPPEEAWGRSAVYDLSAWAGEPTVYLAWRWNGDESDDWYIDDVRVEELQADLSATWTVDAPTGPGDSGVLSVTVQNGGVVGTDDATVTVSFPEGGVALDDSPTVSTGPIAAGAAVTVDLPFTVDLDTPDNSYLPMALDLGWNGLGVSQDETFLVGTASVASVTWYSADVGALDLRVGVGDPEAPTWEGTVFSGQATAGSTTYTLDVTDQGAMLPPAAGPMRWYLKATTAPSGRASDFHLSWDGVDYGATVYPAAVAEGELLVWLPEPPSLTTSVSTSPSSVDPGSTGVRLQLNVLNRGSATTGPLVGTLSTDAADVTLTDAGPTVLAASGLGSGASVSTTAFAFDIASTHTDSSPLALTLTLADDLESWDVPVTVAVPFPAFRVTAIEIDDDGRDGILDPGEHAELSLSVTNVGDESSMGPVSGSLSVSGSSAVAAEVSTNVESLSTIAPNATKTPDAWDVTVDGGADGEDLVLLLTLSDSSRSYPVEVHIPLGEAPWQAIGTTEDDAGDVLDPAALDIRRGEWRAWEGSLQLRLIAQEPIDTGSFFVEMWALSSGADYLYYRVVLDPGEPDLQGYDHTSGFLDLATPTQSYPDAYTVQVDLPLDSMGLLLDTFSLGFGTGWCGPPEYFCDEWPNAWGYPYDSFSTYNWFELSW